MMKKLKKAVSLCLAFVMTIGLLAISASASSAKSFNIIGEGYNLRIEETSIDAYTTEWIVTDNLTGQIDLLRTEIDADGNCSSYGWYDIAGRNIDSDNTLSSDMSVIVTGDKVLYRENGRDASILFSVADTRESVLNFAQNSITDFPSAWIATPPKHGSVLLDTTSVIGVAGALAGLFEPAYVGIFFAIAGIIVANGYKNVYWKRIDYYRALEPLVQESYSVISFYSDPEYDNLIGETTTPVETTYMG